MCSVFQPLLKYSQKVWDNRTGGGRKLLTIFPLDQEISKAVSFAPHPPPPIYLLPACLPLLSGNTHHGPDLVDNKVSKHTSCAAHLMSRGVWRVRNPSQEERGESGTLVLEAAHCITMAFNSTAKGGVDVVLLLPRGFETLRASNFLPRSSWGEIAGFELLTFLDGD